LFFSAKYKEKCILLTLLIQWLPFLLHTQMANGLNHSKNFTSWRSSQSEETCSNSILKMKQGNAGSYNEVKWYKWLTLITATSKMCSVNLSQMLQSSCFSSSSTVCLCNCQERTLVWPMTASFHIPYK
jgi:hypothetical protein